MIGQTLGQYQLVEQIGKGGMATVYKAYQPSLNRYVAIKILPAYFAHEPGFVERFTREAQAIAQLDHPHILPVHDFGKQGEISYIVMKYVPAGTLRDRLGQALAPVKAVELIEQIASALDAAHTQGILHRDVKPGNILIDERGWTYLSDFGLAKIAEGSLQLTGSGVGVGTPAYMSPEQGQGLPVDARTDVYALGVILFEMLTGHVPYEAETPMAVVIKHITAPIPMPRQVNPNIPEVVERVLLKALAKDREGRFASAGAMAAALRQAVQGLDPHLANQPLASDTEATVLHRPAKPGSSETMSDQLSSASPRPRRLPWLPVLGGLGVLLLGGLCLLAGWVYYNQSAAIPTPTPMSAVVMATSLPVTTVPTPGVTAPTPTLSSTATPIPTSGPTNTPSPEAAVNSQQDQLPQAESASPTYTPQPLTDTPTATLTLTLTSTPTPPQPPLNKLGLQENFTDQSLFFGQWESFANDGAVQLVDGSLTLVGGAGNAFPYVHLRQNPFPASGDFALTVELQYTTAGVFGTGMVVGSVLPTNGSPIQTEPDPNIEHYKVWQDTTYYNALMVGTLAKTMASLPAPDTQRHEVQLVYSGGQVQVYLDGALVGREAEAGARPTALWFGNPYRTSEYGRWSELRVYSVSVAEVKPTPTPTYTPAPQTCSAEPQGLFRNLWLKYKDRLGCPQRPEPLGGFYAEQPFQNGHMFWSKLGQLYLIVIGTDQGTWRLFPEDESIWKEGMPPQSCQVTVPSGLVQPIRGFGGLWCAHPEIREKIGWGLSDERGFEDGVDFIQGFERGAIFRDSDGQTRGLAYVLFGDDQTYVREGY